MANIKQTAGTMIPSLILAASIHPKLTIVFSLTIVASIYTTAVPLLWTVSARIFDEKTNNFKIATVVLAMVGTFIGLEVPFDKFVNIIYVINGYVGIILLALMILKSIRIRMKK